MFKKSTLKTRRMKKLLKVTLMNLFKSVNKTPATKNLERALRDKIAPTNDHATKDKRLHS